MCERVSHLAQMSDEADKPEAKPNKRFSTFVGTSFCKILVLRIFVSCSAFCEYLDFLGFSELLVLVTFCQFSKFLRFLKFLVVVGSCSALVPLCFHWWCHTPKIFDISCV